jgi:alpha-glucosidase (family GH31 glycosyl hydrolase)
VDLSQDNTVIAVPLLVSTNGYGLFWNNTSRSRFNGRFVQGLYLSSEVADAIDYYFLYGPELDNVIAGYRDLTGAAPMFGKWAYGFWQCKNRYRSQEELLSVAHQYRQMHIPVDNIVQDWFWWDTMGSFRFNKNYPDAKAMVDDLHRNNFHLMISTWPFFFPGTPVYDDMDKRGFFLDRMGGRRSVSGRHGGLRCHEPGSPRRVLAPDGQRAFQNRRGCLVARHQRARDGGTGREHHHARSNRHRQRRALRQHLPAHA